jgi:hypothetical protein
MRCENCGRRSPDDRSFCSHCGAIASSDSPEFRDDGAYQRATRRERGSPRPSTFRPARSPKDAALTQRPAARSGSSGFSNLVFLAAVFGMAYWFTKTDDFDLITFIRTAIESKLREFVAETGRETPPAANPPARPRASVPAGPSSEPPTSGAPSTTRRASQPELSREGRPAAPSTARRGPPTEIEGLSPAEVEQRLGAPISRVVGGDGVTVWIYQDRLIVYFNKGRASLKPPR